MTTRATCSECGKPAEWEVARIGTEDWLPSCSKHVGRIIDYWPKREGGTARGLA